MKIQKNQLKEIIRPLVKEVMLEVFAQLHLDKIISESVEHSLKRVAVFQERPQASRPSAETPRQDNKSQERLLEMRRKMLDEMHVSSGKPKQSSSGPKTVLTEMLEDTEASGFTIGDSEENTNPELVSDDELAGLVNGQDFSKFL